MNFTFAILKRYSVHGAVGRASTGDGAEERCGGTKWIRDSMINLSQQHVCGYENPLRLSSSSNDVGEEYYYFPSCV